MPSSNRKPTLRCRSRPREPRRARGVLCPAGGRDLVIDAVTAAFVQDLDTEDLGRCHGSVFVGAREGDIEGQDLIAVPGCGQFVQCADAVDFDRVEGIDGRADTELRSEVADQRAGKDGGAVNGRVLVLGTDLVFVGAFG
jgi:hypothetical protein